MTAVLIDYDKIISDTNHSNLKKVISLPPSATRGFTIGLIVIVSKKQAETLSNIPKGEQRVVYINHPEFVNSIDSHYYIFYNQKREICVIPSECVEYLQEVLKACFSGFPAEVAIWTNVEIATKEFMDKLQLLTNNGFEHPYITEITPQFDDIPAGVALVRTNIPIPKVNQQAVLNSILHLLEQFKQNGKTCYLQAKFTSKAIDFLKEASKLGVVVEKGKQTQREITGELYVKDVVNNNGDIVYVIDVDKETVHSGEEENVDVNATRYNFHSHPHEAYIRHNVEKAWPSSTDYLGYHQLGHNTIFHCVATIEGLYILSFSPHWAHHLEDIDKKFISKNYDIDHDEPFTPEEYVEKINKILYKGYPIYEVKFFRWDKATAPFQVFFSQIGSSCLMTQDTVERHKQMHAKDE